MDLQAELARFNPDPALADWLTRTVGELVEDAQRNASKVVQRDVELHAAQTKNREKRGIPVAGGGKIRACRQSSKFALPAKPRHGWPFAGMKTRSKSGLWNGGRCTGIPCFEHLASGCSRFAQAVRQAL
jgi:hypothetical protein